MQPRCRKLSSKARGEASANLPASSLIFTTPTVNRNPIASVATLHGTNTVALNIPTANEEQNPAEETSDSSSTTSIQFVVVGALCVSAVFVVYQRIFKHAPNTTGPMTEAAPDAYASKVANLDAQYGFEEEQPTQ